MKNLSESRNWYVSLWLKYRRPHKSLLIIGSPPRKVSPGRKFTGKNPPRPGGRRAGGFLPVNCRPGETFLGWGRSYNGAPVGGHWSIVGPAQSVRRGLQYSLDWSEIGRSSESLPSSSLEWTTFGAVQHRLRRPSWGQNVDKNAKTWMRAS